MKNQRILSPQPINGSGYDYLPTPDGSPLTPEQISLVGQAVYSRFLQTSGTPDYRDVLCEKTRQQVEKMVKMCVDSLIIKGFKVLPPIG